MGRPVRQRLGFSIIELLIVVAIMGVLSAIAIPGYLRFQLRSKVGEAAVNLRAIATAEEIYHTEHGVYVSTVAPVPAAIPGDTRMVWPGSAAFDELGWEPEGAVVFQYLVTTETAPDQRFLVEAAGDVDGNGAPSFFGFVKPAGGAGPNGRIAGTTCAGTGVFSPAANAKVLLETPGPCDGQSGRSVF